MARRASPQPATFPGRVPMLSPGLTVPVTCGSLVATLPTLMFRAIRNLTICGNSALHPAHGHGAAGAMASMRRVITGQKGWPPARMFVALVQVQRVGLISMGISGFWEGTAPLQMRLLV